MMARKKKKQSYAPVVDAELDLHGHTAYEARDAVSMFLLDARRNAWKRVRIIVGKGLHSTDGPVLPNAVKAHLVELGHEYTYAKLQDGGEGALEVTLR